MSWPDRIRLDTLEACQVELERCTNGLAYLDHLFTEGTEQRDATEATWENWEATALTFIAPEKGITATELKARVNAWFGEKPEATKAKKDRIAARTSLEQVDRWYKSLEKRASNAQSAQKKHLGEGRYGGMT